eukprot:14416387-Alexandrium_andersonii.AAC.1
MGNAFHCSFFVPVYTELTPTESFSVLLRGNSGSVSVSWQLKRNACLKAPPIACLFHGSSNSESASWHLEFK